jgi:hypothetical protein
MVPGTYDLTTSTVYASTDAGTASADARRETVVVTGGGNTFNIQIAQESGTQHRRASGPVTTSGTQLTFTQTCPVPQGGGGDIGGTVGYTVTTSGFTIVEPGGNVVRVTTYVRRGGTGG